MKSNLVDITLVNSTQYSLNQLIPFNLLHSNSRLIYCSYRLACEIELEEIVQDDITVTIDTLSYRVRHQSKGKIIKLKTGNYTYKEICHPLKIVGIIRCRNLYILIERAKPGVADVAPFAPVRVAGLTQAEKKVRLFSSYKTTSHYQQNYNFIDTYI